MNTRVIMFFFVGSFLIKLFVNNYFGNLLMIGFLIGLIINLWNQDKKLKRGKEIK